MCLVPGLNPEPGTPEPGTSEPGTRNFGTRNLNNNLTTTEQNGN